MGKYVEPKVLCPECLKENKQVVAIYETGGASCSTGFEPNDTQGYFYNYYHCEYEHYFCIGGNIVNSIYVWDKPELVSNLEELTWNK